MNEEQQQASLVRKAQQGDQEALSGLIRQHRMKMLNWANRIVRNPAKAEDIVQDALIQTIRRIGSLDNPDKFLPWLRTLVRNQSLMAMRSPSTRLELPADFHSYNESDSSRLDDTLEDPLLHAIGKQALAEVETMLGRLGPREKIIISTHVLEGLTVPETAARLGINHGAVYTALSRARTKLTDFRFETEIDLYLSSKRRNNQPETGHAAYARYERYAGAHDTLCSMMMITAAAYGSRHLTLTDMFAATGHAFRFHAARDLGISGPYSYDWKASVSAGWTHLGLAAALFGGPNTLLQQPDELIVCMDEIRQALARGLPVIAWGLNNAEFGMITGFDDSKGSWSITDTSASGKLLPYSKLGRGKQPIEWFAAVPRQPFASSHRPHSIASILKLAVCNIRGSESSQQAAVSGAAAYRMWIDSFNAQKAVSRLSVAYNLAVVAEARKHAAKFLQQLLEGTRFCGNLPEWTRLAVQHAARLFDQTAKQLHSVVSLFPLPYGADPALPGPADRAADQLSRAAALELEAAAALEEAAFVLNRHSPNRMEDVR